MVDPAGTDGNCTGIALDSSLALEYCPDEEDLNILTDSLSFMLLLRSMQRAREALCSGETRRRGGGETRRRGDEEAGRRGDAETRRRGDAEAGRRGGAEAPIWTPPGGARRGSTPPSWDERNHGRPYIGAGPRLLAGTKGIMGDLI